MCNHSAREPLRPLPEVAPEFARQESTRGTFGSARNDRLMDHSGRSDGQRSAPPPQAARLRWSSCRSPPGRAVDAKSLILAGHTALIRTPAHRTDRGWSPLAVRPRAVSNRTISSMRYGRRGHTVTGSGTACGPRRAFRACWAAAPPSRTSMSPRIRLVTSPCEWTTRRVLPTAWPRASRSGPAASG
jgi:hypothetical protein